MIATSVRPQANRLRSIHIPAPIGGINTVSAGVSMPPEDSIYSFNLIGAEYGLRTRLGWREWCTGLNGEQVRTLIPYTGSSNSGTNNRLFAVTTSGIWDVTSSSASPTLVVGAPQGWVAGASAGWGISTVMVTAAGHFLCYCDEANGYWLYTEATTTWSQVVMGGGAGQVSGVDPAKFVFVCAWKNRLWFVEKDTGRGWYLGVNAITGAATSFTFGARFKAGGDLRGLYSWTFDGGSGIDDALVAVSGGGDVLIYKGTDPSSTSTFGLQGVWFVGAVPAYRRICTDFGGDVLLMSSIGILPLSKLVTGNIIYDRSQYQTSKISNLFNQLQSATSTMRGWSMRLHPTDASLIVIVPTALNQPSQQLVMSLTTKGWHQYRDMPMGVCAEPWGGALYFGTEDGRVCINDGYIDGVLLANPNAYTPIGWSFLTAYGNLGMPNNKRVSTIKVRLLSQGGGINYQAKALYGWDMSEIAAPVGTPTNATGAWDSSTTLWDSATWDVQYQAQSGVFGGAGCAPEVAVAVRGTSTTRMTLTGMDVSFQTGGVL